MNSGSRPDQLDSVGRHCIFSFINNNARTFFCLYSAQIWPFSRNHSILPLLVGETPRHALVNAGGLLSRTERGFS